MKPISATTLWALTNLAVWAGGSTVLWSMLAAAPSPADPDAGPGRSPKDAAVRLAEASAGALTSAPVFSRGRAPINPPGPEPAAAPVALEAPPRLVGILRGPDGARRAVLEGRDAAARRTLSEHGEFGDWQVREIRAKTVLLTRGTDALELRLGPAAPDELAQ